MSELLIEEKNIVIPGEEIAKGMDFLPSTGTFREGESIFSKNLGLLEVRKHVIKVIPLKGNYMPKGGDDVVGIVRDIGFSTWSIDIGCPYHINLTVSDAVKEYVDLSKADISKYFDIGDIISVKVTNVTKSKMISLTMKSYGARKLEGGRLLKISYSKVPRLIGKKGSMIGMIKEKTNCRIHVGQNGYIWINGPAEGQSLVERAVDMIEAQAHTSGLTDRVKEMLEGVKND